MFRIFIVDYNSKINYLELKGEKIDISVNEYSPILVSIDTPTCHLSTTINKFKMEAK